MGTRRTRVARLAAAPGDAGDGLATAAPARPADPLLAPRSPRREGGAATNTRGWPEARTVIALHLFSGRRRERGHRWDSYDTGAAGSRRGGGSEPGHGERASRRPQRMGPLSQLGRPHPGRQGPGCYRGASVRDSPPQRGRRRAGRACCARPPRGGGSEAPCRQRPGRSPWDTTCCRRRSYPSRRRAQRACWSPWSTRPSLRGTGTQSTSH